MFLEGVRTSSIWAALIRILNSRYRLLSYGTILTMAIENVGQGSGPGLLYHPATSMFRLSFVAARLVRVGQIVVASSWYPVHATQHMLQSTWHTVYYQAPDTEHLAPST